MQKKKKRKKNEVVVVIVSEYGGSDTESNEGISEIGSKNDNDYACDVHVLNCLWKTVRDEG